MSSTSSFVSQFGEKLFNPSNSSEVSPSEALAGKDYVLLYFSAHWCPPCRRFTPLLIEFYNKLKKEQNKNIELVFCSNDHDEGEYKEYISDMPWLCMPFQAKETNILGKKYKANGIPHLVIVDAEGAAITLDGTSGVREDSEGTNFPWKPKSFGELWPEQILPNKDGEGIVSSSDLKDKHLMLYFSASWCPPCKAFTPKLSETYKKLKAQRDDFELVFVSSDRDQDSFDEYHKKMSFCALPFEKRDEKSALSKKYDVSGIPTLVMLGPMDENGERPIINDNCRSFMETDEHFPDFPFHKKNYGDVDVCAGELNETRSLIIFCENGDDDEQEDAIKIAKEVAAKFVDKEDDEALNVFWAISSGGIVGRIRELCKLPENAEEPCMVILDIPDNGGYYKSTVTDITVENATAFVEKPGERLQLE